MRLMMKCAAFNLFWLFLIINSVNAQNPSPTPNLKTEKDTATIISNDLKLEFPEIEGWQRSEITKYPLPELGYSVNYDSDEAGRATIYVYDLGKINIPNDVNNNILKNEIERTKSEIQAVGEAGYYQDIKQLKSDTVVLGGQSGRIKSLHSIFNYSMRGKPLVSEIYILGHKKHFIKIRATYPKVEGENSNKALADLLVEIDNLLSI